MVISGQPLTPPVGGGLAELSGCGELVIIFKATASSHGLAELSGCGELVIIFKATASSHVVGGSGVVVKIACVHIIDILNMSMVHMLAGNINQQICLCMYNVVY